MEQFEVIIGKTRDFEIVGISRITYLKWFSARAEITLADGILYRLEPRGFWGMRYHLIKNEVPLFEVKMNIWGKLTITPLKEAHHIYSIKYTGYGKEGYSLTNYKDEILATIASKFTWKSFKETYTLSAQAEFAATESGRLLITLLAYHYRGMQQVAVNTGMVAAG